MGDSLAWNGVAGPGAGCQQRTGGKGHRPDRVADVLPVERLVHRALPWQRRFCQPGGAARGDPVHAGGPEPHLAYHAGLCHVHADGRDRPGRYRHLRSGHLQPGLGPLGRGHLRHLAHRRQWPEQREVDGRAGAGLRRLVGQDAELGPVRAELLFLRGQRQRARRAAAQPATDPELPARRRALDLAGQQRAGLRLREVALVVADDQHQLRPGARLVGPQVAPQRRGRLRLQQRLRQPALGVSARASRCCCRSSDPVHRRGER